MEKLYLREEFIKLGQALKAVNLVENGVDAKICYSGWSGYGKWRSRNPPGQKALRRG